MNLADLSKIEAARDTIDMLYGPPLQVISDCLRGFLIAAPGKVFVGCDFSAIEARVVGWLAGDYELMDVFKHGKDVYIFEAEKIFNAFDIDKKDPRRQVGKVAVLALGFQGGVGAFMAMAETYGVSMEPAFEPLWEVSSPELRQKAAASWTKNQKRYPEMTQKEYIACELTKLAWREAHPKIVRYWYDCEEAAKAAILDPGTIYTAGAVGRSVRYLVNGSFLWCRLPSKRMLCYPYPQIKEAQTPWGVPKEVPTYMAVDSMTNKWERHKAYGGLLVENITQAVARDVMADAMLRLEENGYPVVLTVHDEIVSEPFQSIANLAKVEALMAEVPQWANGLPIAAEGWIGKRYRK